MTPQQENALHAAQIQGDCVRRAMVWAVLGNGASTPVIADIVVSDTARQAIGQTIEYTDEAKMAAGMIPGTTGLMQRFGVKIPSPVAPPSRNG